MPLCRLEEGRAGIFRAKGQLVDDVAGVKLCRLEGYQVVHMHVALLEGLARRDVHVPSHLRPATTCIILTAASASLY